MVTIDQPRLGTGTFVLVAVSWYEHDPGRTRIIGAYTAIMAALVPVVAGAWLFGNRGGLTAGLLAIPSYSLLVILLTENAWLQWAAEGGVLGVLPGIHSRTPEASPNCHMTNDGGRVRVAGFADQPTRPATLLRGDIEEGLWNGVDGQVEIRFGTSPVAIVERAAGGDVTLDGAEASEMQATLHALRNIGGEVEEVKGGIRVSADGRLKATNLSTAPYPGLATDMQAQLMSLLCKAEGTSVLKETIFENRYMHVPELARMGADIETEGRTALVRGVDRLTGAEVMATDLRASMSLIIAALAAEGETVVRRIYHLDRGYERLEEKLSLVGADIERVGDE